MKAYIKTSNTKFNYPTQMEILLKYLNENGKLFISDYKVEDLYREFSSEIYHVGWLHVDEEALEEFADFLSKVDI